MSDHGDLVERDAAVVWHPYTQARTSPPPLPIVGGAGAYLHTADGRRIFDGISSWWVNIHGHAHPALNAALARQAATLEHVMFAGCTHPPAVELAERLVALTSSRLTRVFYSDNGSTAVEVALKMAHQYWRNRGEPGRRTVVAFEHAYHGDTVGAMSVSEPSVFTAAFTDLLFPIVRAEAPYAYRCGRCADAGRCTLACTASLESILRAHAGQVSAVLMEPMLQGAGGMVVWPADFLREVRRLCDEHGVLLIADEVLTGFGRTLASLDLFRDEPVLERVGAIGRRLAAGLETLRDLPCVGEVRHLGGVGIVELVTDKSTRAAWGYLDEVGSVLSAAFLDRGLLLRPLGNILYVMPPYVATDDEVDWVMREVRAVLLDLEALRA